MAKWVATKNVYIFCCCCCICIYGGMYLYLLAGSSIEQSLSLSLNFVTDSVEAQVSHYYNIFLIFKGGGGGGRVGCSFLAPHLPTHIAKKIGKVKQVFIISPLAFMALSCENVRNKWQKCSKFTEYPIPSRVTNPEIERGNRRTTIKKKTRNIMRPPPKTKYRQRSLHLTMKSA